MQNPRQYPILRSSRTLKLAALAAALVSLATPAAAQRGMSLLASFPTLSSARGSVSPAEALRARNLLIPVQGVAPERLRDTYNDARSGGRVHDAIDIHAPRGTPVLATTDGVIIKLHQGARGGLSLYQMDEDGRTRYYYAHLDGYAPGVHEGVRVTRGQVIGYVGDTGNAQPGDCHLHFSIAVLYDRSRWWEGENVNPYSVLRYSRAEASETADEPERSGN